MSHRAETPGARPRRSVAALVWLCLLGVWAEGLSAERLPVRRFTASEGLAHDRVKCIVSGPEGFLWFCTALGLTHFDGRRFTSYGVKEGLPHASVNDLLVASDGTYWAATNGGGVASFRPFETGRGPFVVSPVGGALPGSERVNALFEDRAGRLWAGTDGGLFAMRARGREATFRRVRLPGDLDGEVVQVWSFEEGGDGRLWIGTSHGLVKRAPNGSLRRHPIDPGGASDHVWAVHADGRGRLWIGHERGLVVWRPGEGGGGPGTSGAVPRCWSGSSGGAERLRLPRRPGASCRWLTPEAPGAFPVRAVYEDSAGAVWVAGGGGVVRVTEDGARLYREELDHPPSICLALGEDRAGNLWLGTSAHGAVRLARTGLVSFGARDGLADHRAWSVQEGASGAIYLASPGLWAHRFADGKLEGIRVNLPGDGTGNEVRPTASPHRGPDGTWWFPTPEGIYRFPRVERLEELGRREPLGPWTAEDGLQRGEPWHLFQDSRGDLWIGTRRPERHVLTRWDRSTGTFHRYSDRDGLPAYNPPHTFWESPGGAVWIGFWEGGVARYRDGSFDSFDAGDGVPEGAILAIAGEAGGRLWVGGYGGVAEVVRASSDAPRFRPVPGAEGLIGVTDLSPAAGGGLYAGTVHGLHRIDPTTGGSRRFTVADGLAANWVRDLLRDRQGRLWIGTTDGLSRLDPEPSPPGPPPRALVTGVWVDGEAMPLPLLGAPRAGPYRLERRPERVRLEVAAISHQPGGPVRLRLRNGEGDAPSLPRSEPGLVLSRPSPGLHELRIEALDARGRSSSEPAVVQIRVPPPLWLRPWFLAAAALVAIAGLALTHRLRVRRLLEVERVRARIAGDLHDDLGAHLTRMSVLSEVARSEVRRTPERAASRMAEIGEGARALIDAMSDIVWSIAPRHDRLESLAARIRRVVAELFEGTGTRWTVELEGGDARVAPEQRRHLLLVAKEALHNVARHADAERVTVRLAHRANEVTLEVADDGRGFTVGEDQEAEPETGGGHGLGNLRDRARQLGGGLAIDARPGGGTRVRLTIPRTGSRPRA